jgi:hypothetical protein
MIDAAAAETSTGEALTDLLEEVDRTAVKVFTAAGFEEAATKSHWTTIGSGPDDENGFLALAAKYNLQHYIRTNIEKGLPIFMKQADRPILDYIIEDYPSYPSLCELDDFVAGESVPNLTLLKRLLHSGADPNQLYGGDTVWKRVLLQARDVSQRMSLHQNPRILILRHWSDIAELFIQHDADLLISRDSPIASLIREVFGTLLADWAKELERLLKRNKRRWSSLGKFLVPSLRPRPPPSFEDITPLSVLNKLRSMDFL